MSMPVEIRELMIKTTIVSKPNSVSGNLQSAELVALKKQMLQECIRLVQERHSKTNFDR
jgi:hypothetical protein